MNSNRWVKIHTVESIFESDVLKDALDREGIEYVAREHKDTAYDGIFILQKGYATFFVREKDEAAAQAVIRQIKNLPYVAFSKD
jgi:Putative prokaryotic signal transducing protein